MKSTRTFLDLAGGNLHPQNEVFFKGFRGRPLRRKEPFLNVFNFFLNEKKLLRKKIVNFRLLLAAFLSEMKFSENLGLDEDPQPNATSYPWVCNKRNISYTIYFYIMKSLNLD